MQTLKKIWQFKDLRKRILLTIGILALERVLAHIPMPGVDLNQLQTFFERNQIFGLLNLFSGGTMSNFSIVLMGVGPYITSSIIMQLLTVVVPSLENLQKEGEYGRQKINQYTRYLTVPLAFLQVYGMLSILRSQGVVSSLDPMTLVTILMTTTAGTILVMWLGEIISENGIGNGISLIIALGIIAGFPTNFRNTAALFATGSLDTMTLLAFAAVALLSLLVIALIVFVNEGERRIPVAYARRARGGASYGTVQTHLPLKVNTAGVIPIIFALSILLFPGVIARYLMTSGIDWVVTAATTVNNFINDQTYYSILYFVLVVAFAYFYTFIVFQPEKIAENLQKQGGFIPGIRPGSETTNYITRILHRLTFSGAIFLGVIAILPFIVQNLTNVQTLAIGGTSILIMVSVVLETMRQIQAQLLTRTYDRY